MNHYLREHLPGGWGDPLIVIREYTALARVLGLEGDPLEAIRRHANARRIAAMFNSGLPGEDWFERCAEFAREAHLRRMEPRQAQRMVKGDLLHQALLLPKIHAGLVNTLTREEYGRYQAERLGSAPRPSEAEPAPKPQTAEW